jgi:hypothetical protein
MYLLIKNTMKNNHGSKLDNFQISLHSTCDHLVADINRMNEVKNRPVKILLNAIYSSTIILKLCYNLDPKNLYFVEFKDKFKEY